MQLKIEARINDLFPLVYWNKGSQLPRWECKWDAFFVSSLWVIPEPQKSSHSPSRGSLHYQ